MPNLTVGSQPQDNTSASLGSLGLDPQRGSNSLKAIFIGILVFVLLSVTAYGAYWYTKNYLVNSLSQSSTSDLQTSIKQPQMKIKRPDISLGKFEGEIALGGQELSEQGQILFKEAVMEAQEGAKIHILPAELQKSNIPPTVPPTPVLLPEPTASETPKPDQGEKTNLSPITAYIDWIKLIYDGEIIAENGVTGISAGYSFAVNVKSKKGEGKLDNYIWLIVDKEVLGKKVNLYQLPISSTGTTIFTVYQDMVDYPEVLLADKISFAFYSKELSNIRKEVSYLIRKRYSKKGLATLQLTVASTTSGGTVLDRQLIANANVSVFLDGQDKPLRSATTGTGGFVSIYDLPPGGYLAQADYGGFYSPRDPITIEASDESGGLSSRNSIFVTVPIKPNQVGIVPGVVRGVVVFHGYFETNVKRSGIEISLYKEIRPGSNAPALAGKTTTDDLGLFTFQNVSGEEEYYLKFDPPTGWKDLYPEEVSRPFLILSKGEHNANVLVVSKEGKF